MNSTTRMRRLTSRLLLPLAILAVVATCDDDPIEIEDPEVVEVQITPATVTLDAVGATEQLSAVALDEDGNTVSDVSMTWSSDDSDVATVDNTGLVEAQGDGEAGISAEADGVTGTATVTVEVAVSSVEVTPEEQTVEVGETASFEAMVLDANENQIDGAEVAWTSSEEETATIDDAGEATGVSPGSVTITAESDGVTGTATLIVSVPVASVEVSPDSTELTAIGDTARLTATATDEQGGVIDDAVVTWTSSDDSIATVDEAGLVTAEADGTATVTAAAGDASGTATVTVSPEIATVTITPDTAEVEVGETIELTARAEDENENEIADTDFTWASDGEAFATVDDSGVVTGVAEGTVTITATADGVSGTAEVTVVSDVAAPTLSIVSGDAQNGRTEEDFAEPLVVEVTDADGEPVSGVALEWSVTEGSGTLSETSTTTDTQGQASVTVTSGTSTGAIEVQATSDEAQGGPLTFTLQTTVMVVQIVDNAFVDPQGRTNADFEVDIQVGDTIEWQYVEDGLVTHTATSTAEPAGGAAFDSGVLNPGDTFQFAPQVAGTWTFFCEIHPAIMVDATINVTDPEAAVRRQ